MIPREDDNEYSYTQVGDQNSKKAYASMAAMALQRFSSAKDPNKTGVLMVLAALVIMNMSNGNDLLMQTARRLISNALSKGTGKV